jgi:hypothetical protein
VFLLCMYACVHQKMTILLHVHMRTCYLYAYNHPKICTRVTCRHVDMYAQTCRHVAQICIRGTCRWQRGTCGSQRGTVFTISQHTQTQTQDEPATLPSAASPSLSMEPSAMGPNRGAAAPCKTIAGTRRTGLGSLWWNSLIGAPQWHPAKN